MASSTTEESCWQRSHAKSGHVVLLLHSRAAILYCLQEEEK